MNEDNWIHHQPRLSHDEASSLLPFAFDHAHNAPPYSTSLLEVVASSDSREWLEAAVLAGYVPYREGIALAIRADHVLTIRELRAAKDGGLLGDAIGCAQEADGYRELIAILEEHVVELESQAADLHAQAANERSGRRLAGLTDQDAIAAKNRADDARRRLEILSRDRATPMRHAR